VKCSAAYNPISSGAHISRADLRSHQRQSRNWLLKATWITLRYSLRRDASHETQRFVRMARALR
jgi:hypothetical protein